MISKIPRRGETLFAKLCADAGVTCNPSIEDERGWDYFVQFSPRVALNLPLDMMQASTKVFVQVRTTTNEKTGVRLKLSNAFEFAVTDTPTFVVLFTYNDGDLVRVGLLHFWQAQIERTLKRLRELDSKNLVEIHKHEINFAPSCFEFTDQSQLIRLLQRTIKNIGPNYADSKNQISRQVGFEGAIISGSLKFKDGITIDQIVDSQIGLIDRLDVAQFSARSVRFGIPAGRPMLSGASGTVAIRSRPKKCVVRVSSETLGIEVSIASELFVPAIPNLPPESRRCRVTNQFVQLVFSFADSTVEYSIKADGQALYALADLGLALDLLKILESETIHFQVSIEGRPIFKATGPSTVSDPSPILDELIKFVGFVGGIGMHDIPVGFCCSITTLQQEIEHLATANSLILQNPMEGKFNVRWIDKPLSDSVSGDARVLFYIHVEVADFVIYLIVRRKATIREDSATTMFMVMTDVEYCIPRIFKGTHEQNRGHINAEIEARSKQLADSRILTIGPIFELM